MKFAKALSFLAAVLMILAGAIGSSMAQSLEEGYEELGVLHSHIYYDFGTGVMYTPRGSQVLLAGDVYNNTNPQAPPNFGFSTVDLAAHYGDRVTTTGSGMLQENDFTIYNSGASAGALLTCSFNLALFNGMTNALLGSYTTGAVSFGTGLPPGAFSIITVTGLGGLNINVNTTDVLMRQQVSVKTGAANRLGIASLDPPTIGSSSNQMYINASTVGPAGYYNVGSPPYPNSNPGYRINLNAPTPAGSYSWGSIKALYHN